LYLLRAPRSELDAHSSHAPLESLSGGLADLFRAPSPTAAAGSDPSSPVLFEILMQSERLLAAYFGAPKVGLCILDSDFRYLVINNTLAEMNGIPVAEHLGKSVREMLGDFAEVVESQFKRVLGTGEPVLNIEISFILQNRTEPGHWIEHYVPIKDAAGKVTQIGVVAVEITEQKKLEESLRSVSHKLREEKKRLQVMGR
jgi:PAS domain S-box-containing protein